MQPKLLDRSYYKPLVILGMRAINRVKPGVVAAGYQKENFSALPSEGWFGKKRYLSASAF